MKKDIGTEQSDYNQVPGASCGDGSKGADAAQVDADSAQVDSDLSQVQSDVQSLQDNSVSADISKVQSDLSQLRSLGASPDTDPTAALAAGNKALREMASAISWAQGQANGLDGQAHQIAKQADALAQCSG